jgi:type I site-specific restriction endonuclease
VIAARKVTTMTVHETHTAIVNVGVTKVVVFKPFAVYLVWDNGIGKLIALCPETDHADLVAESLSKMYNIPVEVKNAGNH